MTVQTFYSSRDLLSAKPREDLLFLDIEMPGADGIITAQRIRAYDTRVRIVYATNYADFKNQAFAVHAFGYLVKPYQRAEIQSVLADAVHYTRCQAAEEKEPILFLKSEDGLMRVDPEVILYFECRGHMIQAVTRENHRYTVRCSLAELLQSTEKVGFAVSHKSFVVNFAAIRAIKGYDIYLSNGDTIPLAQKKAAAFKEDWMEYMVGTYDEV